MKKPKLRTKPKTVAAATPAAAAGTAAQIPSQLQQQLQKQQQQQQQQQPPQPRTALQVVIDSNTAIQQMRAALNSTNEFYTLSLQEVANAKQQAENQVQQLGAQFTAQAKELKDVQARNEELESYLESLEEPSPEPTEEPPN